MGWEPEFSGPPTLTVTWTDGTAEVFTPTSWTMKRAHDNWPDELVMSLSDRALDRLHIPLSAIRSFHLQRDEVGER